ncbi:Crp/Fnr family transcriptional regulator [Hymenobacter sediminicola]|uniref:Crp/Fnr family transcriptional regulator n=1 Tax=Hymenobacter sediminicola TaxID=2761579 RepID=A0A7G7W6Z0_9BACT|nr:Crp/Fnr family transcriptional regulator [Hymenobacter sediminicola]QNH62133.1 Crp/Fnr family transcriptional regulator [Hymenobacter sediminicola]
MPVSSLSADIAALRQLLQQVPYLAAADVDAFVACWHKPVVLARHDFLIRPEQTERYLYFVAEGVLRIFLPVATEEICVGFGYAGTLLCSFPSFVEGRPSDYAIQALRGSRLLGISRAAVLDLLESRPAIARFWRTEMERAVVGRIEREIDLLLPEPQRRLDRLRTRSPHLFQLVPRKYIASYLRMTPETLSRLR